MADEEETETADLPRGEKKEPKEKKSSPWGWIIGLFVAAIGMLAIAGLSWWMSKKGKELAKLKHERDVREAKAQVDRVNAHIAKNNEESTRLIVRATKLGMQAEAIDKEVKELETATKAIKDQIDAIKDWDSVDRYLAGGSSDGSA